MSSKLEDLLSDSDEEQEVYHEEDYPEEEYNQKRKRKLVERFSKDEPEKVEAVPEDLNQRIMKMLMDKLRDPVIVTLIMMALTHPLLIQGIFRIPYVEVVDQTISINIVLSILAGIIFFLIREFV